jgi:hypothetical protein
MSAGIHEMPAAPVRDRSWWISTAVSVIVVVIANMGIFFFGAVIMLHRAQAEPVSIEAQAPVEVLRMAVPSLSVAPVSYMAPSPVRIVAAKAKLKSCSKKFEAPVRIARRSDARATSPS